jgi:hypothetical protein
MVNLSGAYGAPTTFQDLSAKLATKGKLTPPAVVSSLNEIAAILGHEGQITSIQEAEMLIDALPAA